EARNDAHLHWVLRHAEHNWDRCGCSFGCERGLCTAGRRDHSRATPHQVGQHRWQAFIMALQPVVLNYDILTLDITSFAEPLAEGGYRVRGGIAPPEVDEPAPRPRCLLRPRPERPCSRAAEQRDEVAAFHSIPSSARARTDDEISS